MEEFVQYDPIFVKYLGKKDAYPNTVVAEGWQTTFSFFNVWVFSLFLSMKLEFKQPVIWKESKSFLLSLMSLSSLEH